MSSDGIKKSKAIMLYLESVVNAAEEALAIEDAEERKNALKGSLFYWLGISYDEGQVYAKDMETALNTQNEIVKKLKSRVAVLEDELDHKNKERGKRDTIITRNIKV